MFTLFLIAFIAFALIVLAMSVGAIFQGRCIRGSCGGEAIYGPEGEMLNCETCPVRKEKTGEGAAEAGTSLPRDDAG